MKEKFKKYWKIILIIILVIFGLNKCTQSCNRNSEINRLKSEITIMDSCYKHDVDSISELVKVYKAEIDKLHEVNGVLRDNNNSMQTQIYKKDSINASKANQIKIIRIKEN